MLYWSEPETKESDLKVDLSRRYPANYDAHARTVAADAYWQQVRRTVNGMPVDEAQIGFIVKAITAGLSLAREDVILDLACGNGALSAYLFDKCGGLLGVDISPYLIEVAQLVFARMPNYRFELGDVVSFLSRECNSKRFTKALIYGSFHYFPRADVVPILKALHDGFPTVTRVFIGNVPDKARTDRFFFDAIPAAEELENHEARLGVWYLPEEVVGLANAAGWRAGCSRMPTEFYQSSYRFDVTLERNQ
jgi:SAM-dependent methyltransferase